MPREVDDLDYFARYGLEAIIGALKKHHPEGDKIGVLVVMVLPDDGAGLETATSTNMCPYCMASVVQDIADDMRDEECNLGVGHA